MDARIGKAIHATFPEATKLADRGHLVIEAARAAASEAEARLTDASPQDKFFGVWRAALDAAANASHRLGDVADAEITQIADEVSAHLKPNPR